MPPYIVGSKKFQKPETLKIERSACFVCLVSGIYNIKYMKLLNSALKFSRKFYIFIVALLLYFCVFGLQAAYKLRNAIKFDLIS